MPRIVKEYSVRRSEIIDAAQRLIYTKSYEQMTIQDILVALQISKGGFFHYFSSKQDLLEAVIERMLEEGQKMIDPILQDPDLPALEKLQRIYATSGRWKTDHKEQMIALMRVWYADDNVLVRQKLLSTGARWYVPMINTIIEQGMAEGVLQPAYPDQVPEIALTLIQGMGDGFANLLFRPGPAEELPQGEELRQRLESLVAAYADALERVLGAPTGSIHIMDSEMIREWSTNDI